MPIYTSDFYVYAYLRAKESINGPVGSIYYIGKGKGKRAYTKNRIEIGKPKDRKDIIFLSENMSNTDAKQAEMLLIYQYGRIDLGTGSLRNKTNGGEGSSGRVLSEQSIINASEAQKNKPKKECEHCTKYVDNRNFAKWHGGKCKLSPNYVKPPKQKRPPRSEEHRRNLSKTKSGQFKVYNAILDKEVNIKSSELLEYIDKGYVQGQRPRSDKHCKEMSQIKLGTVLVREPITNKGTTIKYSELTDYLERGYVQSRNSKRRYK